MSERDRKLPLPLDHMAPHRRGSCRPSLLLLAITLLLSSSSLALQLQPLPPAAPPPKIYTSASSIPNPPPNSEPFNPSPLDDFLLSAFRWTLQQQSGLALHSIPGFDGMMAELHELRRTKGTDELERVSLLTMTALAGPIPWLYKKFFAEWEATPALLAWSAKLLLPFLVGDMTLTTRDSLEDLQQEDGNINSISSNSDNSNSDTNKSSGGGGNFFTQGGGLLVQKCRVLEGSNCKGICTKMCKVPTQRFFAERWGVPLSMEPNFETGACQLRFGVEAKDLEEDGTIPGGCLVRCPASIVGGAADGGLGEDVDGNVVELC